MYPTMPPLCPIHVPCSFSPMSSPYAYGVSTSSDASTYGVVSTSNMVSDSTVPIGPRPRFRRSRANAAMSSTFDTMEPSTVLDTVKVAGTSGWRSCAGRSVNTGS